MLKFLPRIGSVILKNADVLEARIAFEILDTMRRQQQELLGLRIVCVPNCRSCRGFSTSTSCAPTGDMRS